MNKLSTICIILLLFMTVTIFTGSSQNTIANAGLTASAPSTGLLDQINICKWKGGARTGVSLSFDDNCETHRKISLMLDEYGFKGSFFAITSRMLVDSLTDMQLRGHEIGNHTSDHLNLTQLDSLELDHQILQGKTDIESTFGTKCLTFASTFHSNTELIRSVGFEHHLFIRNVSEYPNIKRDREDVGGLTTSVHEVDSLIHTTMESGEMLLLTGHGIDDDGYDPIPGDSLRQILDSLKYHSDRGDIWVSTLRELIQYENLVQEIQLETKVNRDTMVITLNGYLAEKYRDMDQSPLCLEFIKSADDTIQYFGKDLLLTQKSNTDIITVDLKKTNVVKALVLSRVSSRPINRGQNLLSVFPNPASDFLTISSSQPIIQAEIYNLAGQLMLLKTGPAQRLDTSGLKSGLYV